jgi:hypothetical protein
VKKLSNGYVQSGELVVIFLLHGLDGLLELGDFEFSHLEATVELLSFVLG